MAFSSLPAGGLTRTPAVTYKYNNTLPIWVQPPDPSADNLEKSSSISTDDRQATFNAEGGVLPIIYGEQRVGSKIVILSGWGNFMWLGVAFCEGPVESITSLEIDNTAYDDVSYSGKLTVETFLGSQTTASSLLKSSPFYSNPSVYNDEKDSLTGTVYAVVKFLPFSTSGFPTITAQIKGRKVYDPRDADQILTSPSTWKWSDNPALCLADLISSSDYGLGKSMDWDSVATVANYNDNYIGTPSEKSRTLNIVVDSQQYTSDWIETLRGYASCFVVPSSDGYKLIPDKPIGYGFRCIGNINTYLQVPYSPLHEMSNELSFDVSVMPNDSGSGTTTIFSKGSDYRLDYIFPTASASGTLSFSYTDTNLGLKTLNLEQTLSTTEFTTISLALRKNGVYSVCLNGIYEPTSATYTVGSTVSIQQSISTPIYIGKNVSGNPFYGIIDEVRLWNRCRTLAEIQSEYNKLIPSTKDSSLILHLPFNEGYASNEGLLNVWTLVHRTKDVTNNTSNLQLVSPTTDPWYQHDGEYDFFRFDGTNVIKNSTKFKKRGIANIPTVVEVSYTDTSTKPWKDGYARVDASANNGDKIRVSNIPMPGVVRYSQAMREAIERYNGIVSDTTVTFSAFDETLIVEMGAPIQFHHPVIEETGTNFFKPYRITSLRQKGDGRWDIGAIEYDPENYSTTIATQETFADTNFPRVDAPEDITDYEIEEILYQLQDGTYTSRIRVTWLGPEYPFIRGYRVSLYKNDGSHDKIEEIEVSNTLEFNSGNPRVTYLSGSSLNLLPTSSTSWKYYVKVQTISTLGAASTGVQLYIDLQGKYLAPGNVPSITGFEAGGKVFLKWTKAVDIDIWRYHIKQGDTTAISGHSLATQWATDSQDVDIVDGLTYTAFNMPTGTRRFFIKAIDSVGNESSTPAYIDIVVDKDDNAFTLGEFAAPCDTAASTHVSSFTLRPEITPRWITDFGDTWNTNGDALTAVLTDSVGALVIPIPHDSLTSVWTSAAIDYGTPLGGGFYSGYATVVANVNVLSGTVNQYLEYSTDGTSWTQVSGTSAVVTARYLRFKVEGSATAASTDTNAAFSIVDDVSIKFDIVIREETGIATTNTTDVGGDTLARVSLERVYNFAKNIQITVQGSGSTSYTVQYEDVSLGGGYSPNRFDIYVLDSSNTKVSGVTVSWLFKGI